MRSRTRKLLMGVLSLAMGLMSLFAVGCSCAGEENKQPKVDKLTVFDVSSEEFSVGSDRTRVMTEYLSEATVGGKTGEYLKLKTVTSSAGGADFMFKPAFEKAHYEQLASESANYVVTLEFYLDITFRGAETDANGKVSGIYMWGSVFGINEGQWGYPQRDTGWYTFTIRLSEFIDHYETVEKLYTGRRTSGIIYSIIHTHSNIPTDYDFYIKDIMITEDPNLPPEPDPATPEMIINPTDVTSPQFKVGESWKDNMSSEALAVEKTQVTEVNGKTGNFTRYNVTFNTKGNARFDVKFTKLPANDLDNYQALVAENPNLQVKLYVYVDTTQVFHPDHETLPEKAAALRMISDIQSPMFGVSKFNGNTIYGTKYEYSKVISLSEWIAINYEGENFRNYAIFGAGFSDTLKAGSVMDLYLSVEIGDFRIALSNAKVLDTANGSKNTFKVAQSWGTIATSDLAAVSEQATAANGKTGDYIKHTVTINKQGNALFGIYAQPALTYDDYVALSTDNPNLKLKLTAFLDSTQVFHPDHETNADKAAALKMNSTFKSSMFGVTQVVTGINTSTYEYTTEITLAEWLNINYVNGVWQDKSVLSFGASDTIKAGSILTCYAKIEIVE